LFLGEFAYQILPGSSISDQIFGNFSKRISDLWEPRRLLRRMERKVLVKWTRLEHLPPCFVVSLFQENENSLGSRWVALADRLKKKKTVLALCPARREQSCPLPPPESGLHRVCTRWTAIPRPGLSGWAPSRAGLVMMTSRSGAPSPQPHST
jgi:hypothetical protein